MISVKSHLQPKFFLKGFLPSKNAANQSDFLYVYKKGMPFKIDGSRKENNPAKVGLDNVAFVKNFYSFLKEDGTEDPVTYENRLSVEIEQPANQVLERLRLVKLSKNESIKISDFLSDDERSRFARYVAGMCARGQRNRKWFNEALEKTIRDAEENGFSYAEMTSRLDPSEKVRADEQILSLAPDFDVNNDRLPLPPEFLEAFRSKVQKNEFFPESIFRGIDKLEPQILNLKWQIRTTPPLQKFFTGDDPVYWTSFQKPNPMLLFPIATNVIFVASGHPTRFDEGVFLEKNEAFIRDVRKNFIQKCRELYFSQPVRWLVDYFNNN